VTAVADGSDGFARKTGVFGDEANQKA